MFGKNIYEKYTEYKTEFVRWVYFALRVYCMWVKYMKDELKQLRNEYESLHRTLLLELHPEHITGKYIVEA